MWLVRTAIVLVAVAVVGLVAVWSGQRRLIYFPDRSIPAPDPGLQSVILATSDGLRLTASFMRPAARDRKVAVLVLHGNAGHRGDRAPLAAALAEQGFSVLLVDYRGYGGNPGSPSEDGLVADARAALAYLENAGFSADRIVYFGESLGAAVATRLATERAPAALVLRSPFTDLAAVAGHHYPWLPVRSLLRDRYPVADLVAGLDVPTTVIVGSADRIIPPAQSRAVGAHGRLVELDGAGHNDARLAWGPEVIAAVVDAAGG
jgi:pimeloyl-ACP methyl ester carboxylesterase